MQLREKTLLQIWKGIAMDKNEIQECFRQYLSKDTFKADSFRGRENIELYLGNTLSDAWLSARPHESDKVNDMHFKKRVDSANGKWLEKQWSGDSYKIILATQNLTVIEVARIYCHELRHCLDYQCAVNDYEFEHYIPGNVYYNKWSEFKAVEAHVRFSFFMEMPEVHTIDKLAAILGVCSADSLEGILHGEIEKSKADILYFISRYLGASIGVRNLGEETGNCPRAFHIWHMTPAHIV